MRHLLIVPFLAGAASPVTSGEWCSADPSTFSFKTTFESEVLPGEFRVFDVRYTEAAGLHVTVDLAAADMGDADMNEVLADPAWFGTETFPEAEFAADEIITTGAGRFVAEGVLDLKGVQQPVAVPFAFAESEDSASMQGELSLRRTDFDVGSGEWSTGEAIGLDVRLVFDIRLERCD